MAGEIGSSGGDRSGGDGGRNSASTIARILAGAEAEFGSKGLDGAKIDDIAKAAGISKQLIYHYFKGKDDLYGEMLLHIARRNLEQLCVIEFDRVPPLVALASFFDTLFSLYESNPFSSLITLDQGLHGGAQVRYHHEVERLREQLYTKLGSVLAQGKEEGLVHPEVDVVSIHFLAVVLVSGSLALHDMFAKYTRRTVPQGETGARGTRAEFLQYFMRAISA